MEAPKLGKETAVCAVKSMITHRLVLHHWRVRHVRRRLPAPHAPPPQLRRKACDHAPTGIPCRRHGDAPRSPSRRRRRAGAQTGTSGRWASPSTDTITSPLNLQEHREGPGGGGLGARTPSSVPSAIREPPPACTRQRGACSASTAR